MLSPLQRQILGVVSGLPEAAPFALATEKGAGFSRDRFLEAFAAFDRLDPDEFDLSAADYRQLRDGVNDWPLQIDHRRGRRRGR